MKIQLRNYSVILFFLLLFPFTHQAQKFEDLDPVLQKSVKMVGESWNILDECVKDIWPAWDYFDKEAYFTLMLKGQDVLISPPGEPDGKFKLLDYKLLGKPVYMRKRTPFKKVWGGKRSFYINKKRFRAAQFRPPKEGNCKEYYERSKSSFPLKIDSEVYENYFYSPEYYIGVIVHEAFHLWQIRINKTKSINAEHPSSFTVDHDKGILTEIEGKILAKAFLCDNKSDLLELSRQFLAVRYERRKGLTDKDIHWEQRNEFLEGSAMYVQAKAMNFLANGNYEHSVLNEMTFSKGNYRPLLDSLRLRNIDIDHKSMTDDSYALHRCYYYGMVQAFILEKLCGFDWQKSYFNEDVYLETLLEKYCGFDINDYRKYLDSAIMKFASK